MQPVTPYSSPDSKKVQVAQMFDNIAHSYDFLNHFFSLGIDKFWRKKALKLLQPLGPHRILDVATGTADFALGLAKSDLPATEIIGVDISKGMLEIGEKKVAKANLTGKIKLLKADSESLPFEANSFDAITVAFGVRNFENLNKGLAEMSRVLKPTGMMVILEFSKPHKFPMKQLFGLYFKGIMPAVGSIISRDRHAYSYLPESVNAFPEGEAFLLMMREAGLEACVSVSLTGGVAAIYTGTKR